MCQVKMNHLNWRMLACPLILLVNHEAPATFIGRLQGLTEGQVKQARKLQATLEGCNPKLSLTDSLTDMGKV